MPNTDVFLSAMSLSLDNVDDRESVTPSRSVLLLGDAHLVRHVALTRHLGRLGFDDALFLFAAHRSLERDLSRLRDDLDVVRVGGQILVLYERVADRTRQLAVGGVLFLLIGGLCVLRPIACVDFRVVGCRCLRADTNYGYGKEPNDRDRKNCSFKKML